MKEIFLPGGAGSPAGVGTGVGEAPGGGDEPPVVAAGVERQREPPEGLVLADLAVRRRLPLEGLVEGPARPHDELAHARRVEAAARVLAGEALGDVGGAREGGGGPGGRAGAPEGRDEGASGRWGGAP